MNVLAKFPLMGAAVGTALVESSGCVVAVNLNRLGIATGLKQHLRAFFSNYNRQSKLSGWNGGSKIVHHHRDSNSESPESCYSEI